MKSKRNKIVNISIIVFIAIVVLCTYFSKTVKNMLLPEVTVAYLKPGTIGEGFEGTGTISYNGTHKIYSMPGWSIKEVSVKLNQSVKKGDVLAKVDNDAINLKEREEQSVIMQLQDEIDTLKKSETLDQNKIKEDQYKLDTEKQKFSLIRNGLTADGSILSDVDGKIVSINSKSGENSSSSSDEDTSGDLNEKSSLILGEDLGVSGSAIFEIVNSNPSLCVKWTASPKEVDKFSTGTKVNIINGSNDENDSKNAAVTAAVSEKKYNPNKDEYEISAVINDKTNLRKDDKVTVATGGSTKRYNNVIPKSCLYEENGIDYVYKINSGSNGVLGEESSVKKVQVQIVAFDSMNCSIKAANNSELSGGIITNTSKPINDNDEVKCTFTAASR